MVDFIHEVEEELRKDKYNALLRKFGPYILGLIVAIVALAGVMEYKKAETGKKARAASSSYIAAEKLSDQGEKQKAIDQFVALAEVAPNGYAGRSLDMAASLELARGNKEQAIVYYDRAANTYHGVVHKDLSAYKSALIVMDLGRFDDVTSRAASLDYEDGPYADLAKELTAQAELKSGKLEQAKAKLSYLSSVPGVQQGVSARANQALALIKTQEIITKPAVEDVQPSDKVTDDIKAPKPVEPIAQEE